MQIAILTIVMTNQRAGVRHRAIVAANEQHVYREWGRRRSNTVKPGEWVTGTSRHQSPTEGDAVVSVSPYGASTITERASDYTGSRCLTSRSSLELEATRVYVLSMEQGCSMKKDRQTASASSDTGRRRDAVEKPTILRLTGLG